MKYRVKEVRLRKALTQQELADRTGLSRAALVKIEAGKSQPYPGTVRKIAEALGVTPEDLLDEPALPLAS